jgi:hypothetical protein
MKIRHSRAFELDTILTAELRGAILHPDLHAAIHTELEELERKDKLCRLPTTLLDNYSRSMERRIELLQERCRKQSAMLLS